MLWPYFKQAREDKKKAYLKRDKLFIDGNEFILPDDDEMETNDGKKNYETQDKLGIQRKRHSTDLNVNTYGRKLIQFCKNNNMYIMNGRIGNDEVGKPTSKNTSVVDYAISTADVLYLVENFDVLPFSSLYSDIHCPLELVLNCSNTKQSNVNINVESGENNTYIGKWNHDQVNEYKENLDKESISQLLSFIMTKTENVQNVDKNTIDEIVNEIRDVLLNSARNTFGEFVQKTYGFDYTGGKQNHRDWFNTECRRERRAFRKSKRLYKRYGSRIFKERLRRSETLYKKTMDKNIRSFNVDLRSKMKKMRTKNPKEFWKIINRARKWSNEQKHNGHCYIFSKDRLTWEKAKKRCEEISGYLVKIDNEKENQWLAERARKKSSTFWIGLLSETDYNWKWANEDKKPEFLKFKKGYPIKDTSSPRCVYLYYNDYGYWRNYACRNTMRYVCETNKCKYNKYSRMYFIYCTTSFTGVTLSIQPTSTRHECRFITSPMTADTNECYDTCFRMAVLEKTT
ncbi:unnamed protein product [Mytilus edulis]|uniref:C-type lectin domain-containing protein n=1 Tax=Mytilus edulis TaxID=6550 RepID=A0A8S3PR77_MYTED|nr:unnamed protein product [Mytilus edulis]